MTRLLAVVLSCLFLASCALLENQGIVPEGFVDPVTNIAEPEVVDQEIVQDLAEPASTPVQVDPDPTPVEEVALSPTQPGEDGSATAKDGSSLLVEVVEGGPLIDSKGFATDSLA